MVGNVLTDHNLKFIDFLQNPINHVVGDFRAGLSGFNIDPHDQIRWIEFEDRFSIENISGYDGKTLHQIALILSVVNMQGGVASNYVSQINLMPKEQVLSLYYKYLAERKISYTKNIFELSCRWLKENKYICELELNRLLVYKVKSTHEFPILEAFNHKIIQEDILSYVQKY